MLNLTVFELYENKLGTSRVNVTFVSTLNSGFLWVGRETEDVISVVFCLKTLSREVGIRKFRTYCAEIKKENMRVFRKPVAETNSLHY
jgi:hypothetical protein